MKDKLIRQAKKNYEKLSKDIKELFTEEQFIEEVIKKYKELKIWVVEYSGQV